MMHGANATPEHPSVTTCKCHAKVVEVPQYRAECLEERDSEDHVPFVQRDGVALHREELVGDANANIAGKATTLHAVTVGDDDARIGTWCELQPNTACHVSTDKIICRT
jgi:hypothetical protein